MSVMDMMGAGGGGAGGGGGGADLASMLGIGGGGQQAPPPDAGGGDADSQYQALIDGENDPNVLVQWAKLAISKAIDLEPDHADALVLEDINSRAQKYLATQQQVADQAGGAGPGAKALRKAYGGA